MIDKQSLYIGIAALIITGIAMLAGIVAGFMQVAAFWYVAIIALAGTILTLGFSIFKSVKRMNPRASLMPPIK